MSTPWPDRSMSDRSLRVAMTGCVHDDDPTIIADMQQEIERLGAEIEVWRAKLATQCGHTLAAQALLNRELESNSKRDCPETL